MSAASLVIAYSLHGGILPLPFGGDEWGESGEAVAEKIRGTVHLAISDSSHMGRMVTADLHQDFVIPGPDLLLDGKLVIEGGQWKM